VKLRFVLEDGKPHFYDDNDGTELPVTSFKIEGAVDRLTTVEMCLLADVAGVPQPKPQDVRSSVDFSAEKPTA